MPYFVNDNVLSGRHQKGCPSAQPRRVICVDQYGMFNKIQYNNNIRYGIVDIYTIYRLT